VGKATAIAVLTYAATVKDSAEEEEQDKEDVVAEAFRVVSKLRPVAKYVKNSPKAKEKLIQFGGSPNNYRDTVTIELDVRTRWNSALDMLTSILELKTSFVTFLHHLRTSEGKEEFNRQTLPPTSEEEWIFIDGLCLVLTPFKNVTSYLSGNKYPTFTKALPQLRLSKTFLLSAQDYLLSNASSCGPAAEYCTLNEDFDNFHRIVQKFKACCAKLLEELNRRFEGMNIDILWVTLLDPQKQTNETPFNRRVYAKNKLFEEVTKLAVPSGSGEVSFHHQIDDDEDDPFFGSSMFDSITRTERDSIQEVDSGMPATADEYLRISAVTREAERATSTLNCTFQKELTLLNGGESIDSSFHKWLLLRENGFVFQALQHHLSVFSLNAVLH
jgi:hypothetical protein